MTAVIVLGVVAMVQGAFLVLLVIFLVVRRTLYPVRRDSLAAARAVLGDAVNRWLVSGGSIEVVRDAMRAFPAAARVGYVAHLVRSQFPAAERVTLSGALRDEAWVRRALKGATSRRWGRRLEAARALAFVGTDFDRRVLGGLLVDTQPAVAIAAVSALPAVADATLVARVVEAYPTLPDVVRRFIDATLRELREETAEALAVQLVVAAPARSLSRWIGLAEALDLLPVLDRAMALHAYDDARVRAAVARAARRLPRTSTVQLLAAMAHDGDPGVRVEAVRSLGELGVETVPVLTSALHDGSWQVRRQAALSLAMLGERGRAVLRAGRGDADPYVRDIASLVSGLSNGALLELTSR